jgi:hypothetical protein
MIRASGWLNFVSAAGNYGSETMDEKRVEDDWPPRRRASYVSEADVKEFAAAKKSAETLAQGFVPWVSMLVRPATTIRRIVQIDPQMHVMLVSCLYGMYSLLKMNDGVRKGALTSVNAVPLCLIVLLVGPVIGIISVSVMSWCNRIAARFLGGQATEHETQAAVAWSVLPHIYAMPIALATATLNAPDLGFDRTALANNLTLLNLLFRIIASLWSFILCVIALAEVNRFAWWRALLTLVVAFLMIGVIFAAVALFFIALYFVLS